MLSKRMVHSAERRAAWKPGAWCHGFLTSTIPLRLWESSTLAQQLAATLLPDVLPCSGCFAHEGGGVEESEGPVFSITLNTSESEPIFGEGMRRSAFQ